MGLIIYAKHRDVTAGRLRHYTSELDTRNINSKQTCSL